MKIPWSSVWAVVRAVYVAFLHGRIVSLPGIPPVTLPSEGHEIPIGLYDAHRSAAVGLPPLRPLTATQPLRPLPEGMELPRDEKRRPPKPPREDGLPEVVQPDAPLSVKTLGAVLFVVVGMPIIALTLLGWVEWRTLADDVPGNHISATLRAAWARAPGAVFLFSLVWCCFLVAIAIGLASHFFFYQ